MGYPLECSGKKLDEYNLLRAAAAIERATDLNFVPKGAHSNFIEIKYYANMSTMFNTKIDQYANSHFLTNAARM